MASSALGDPVKWVYRRWMFLAMNCPGQRIHYRKTDRGETSNLSFSSSVWILSTILFYFFTPPVVLNT